MTLLPASIRSCVTWHVVALVVALLIVAGLGYIGLVRPMMEDRLWVVGACIDYDPVAGAEPSVAPAVVGCGDDRARAQIVGVLDRDATLADCEPLGSSVLVDRRNATYCVVELTP